MDLLKRADLTLRKIGNNEFGNEYEVLNDFNLGVNNHPDRK